ncbi:CDP-glycerol glycerophosphotransferase family protein [Candidatus Nitrosotenuis uzonensis]|uniref:UDP-N-acetylglucosamine 2-epimerase domain-containing protein n=1 Tax=Candidatus Nitrosotenuis uzonensis TaxID=1407055 RepID=A0A812EWK6_9ARCH|nr:CDP-glycerol glycerophosphotransferase family protein [Candidatus Nitrosotenuis uzonensis]CAE6486958.1 hypothetical protein NUZ5A_20239 [Candidatus Nitrosotenuis uzonensis]
MNRYEVITDFTVDNLEIAKKIVDDNYIWLTNNWQLVDQLENHINIETIDNYIRKIDLSSFYKIFSSANENIKLFQEGLSDVKFEDISIVEGVKNLVYSYFVFLEQIQFLFKTRRDFVFLFSNTESFYFAIKDLAKNAKYQSMYDIATIIEKEVIKLHFDETENSDKRFLYHETRFLYDNSYKPTESEKEKSGKIIDVISSEEILDEKYLGCAFFLNNNNADLYLKPVYPILQKFAENKYNNIIFTFDNTTTNQLKEKNFEAINLIDVINRLTPIILENKSELILEFLNSAKKIRCKRIVVNSYIKIIKNDPIARFVALVISKILVIDLLIKKSELKSIFVALDPSPDMDLVCAVAKKYKIKTYSFPTTPAIKPIAFMADMYNAENILVDGSKTKEIIRQYVNEKKITIVGNPRYDYTAKIMRTKESTKHVFIAMSRWHEDDEKWIPEIIQFCNDNKLRVTIKPHPVYNMAFRDTHQRKINEIMKRCIGLKYEIQETTDSSVIINADVVITERSTIGVEAAVNDIPIILVKTNNKNEDLWGYNFLKEGVGLFASNIKELKMLINKILFDQKLQQKLAERREKFKQKMNYLNDGKASDRIYEIMTR